MTSEAPTLAVPPRELAALIAGRHPLQVIGLDVDGVLAPIVEHADRARLLPGTVEILRDLAEITPTAAISGRALADLERRYGFPETLEVIGSHGLESRLHPNLRLDRDEENLLTELRIHAQAAAAQAGPGAWCEHKPASVVLHTRSASPTTAQAAVDDLIHWATDCEGAHLKRGHEVVELMARPTSKAAAIADLRERHGAQCMTYFGDDLTDEEVFASFGPNDISVRVGSGPTLARYRLPGPYEVQATLVHLLELTQPGSA